MRLPWLAVFGIACSLNAQNFIRVSSANHRYLEDSNGKAFVPIGPNIAWERFATGEPEVFRLTEARFRSLAENGGNFARVFLSHPFYDIDFAGDVEQKLRRIDRLIALARKHGIRLKLCIEHFRSLDNDPPRFPGSVSFGRPEYASMFRDITEYFQSPRGRELFTRKLDLLSARYANEPTVFGWELWNEINAVKGTGWEQWTQHMLGELKKRFPHQFALQSLGSFDSGRSAEMYERFSRMPGNQIAQAHRYLDPGAPLEVCRGPVDVLAADAVRALLSYTQDRPVLLSEVGAVEARHAGPSKLYPKDGEGVLLHDGLFAAFFAGAAGPGQFWHWQDYIETNDLWHHFGRFAEAIRGIDPRQEHFEPRFVEYPSVRAYVLTGRRNTMIWLRDRASDWRSELVDGKPPATLSGVRIDAQGQKAVIYDPWAKRHFNVRIRDGKLTLPPFRRSLVVRIPAD